MSRTTTLLCGALTLLLLGACASGGPRGGARHGSVSGFELIASATLDSDLEYAATRVGGLSGLAWSEETGRYLAVSDDPSEHAPARVYELSIDRSADNPTELEVEFHRVVSLHDDAGRTFARGTIDPEGIQLTEDGFWVSSEGNARARIAPSLIRYDAEGKPRAELSVPSHYEPEPDVRGVRDNQAFESLTITPDGRFLFTATEGAIYGDGPSADVGVRTPARILRYDLNRPDSAPAEFRYWAEAVTRRPALPGAFRTAGLVELLALDRERFLALERSFGVGIGYAIRIWEVRLADATELSSALGVRDDERPVTKKLLVDFRDLGIAPRNVEGMAFGPDLPDGRQRLVLVADNNFRDGDRTQILMLAVTP